MIWQTWRQHRVIAIITASALLGMSTFLIILGHRMYQNVDSLASATCASSSPSVACQAAATTLGNQATLFHNVSLFLLGVPALLGLFVGAPLIAREFEQRTYQLAWTQGVTRHRWLTIQLVFLALGIILSVGLITALMSWAENALLTPTAQLPGNVGSERFSVWGFDLSGLAPVAYTMFALALGIAAGALFRRTLAAIGVTLAGFLAVRLPVTTWLRPQIQPPIIATGGFTADSWVRFPGPFDWRLEEGYLHEGHKFIGSMGVPSYCAASNSDSLAQSQCLQAHGWSQYIIYQPANQYWHFQIVEAAIFFALTAVLVGLAFYLIGRRAALDANS